MNARVANWLLALLLGIIFTGCEPPKPAASNPAGPPLPPPPPGAVPPPVAAAPAATTGGSGEAALPAETKVGVFAGGIDELAARPAAPPTAGSAQPGPDAGTERVKAEKGVGIKGRSLDQYEGILVTPAKAYFTVRERIVFEDQIPHALNLYKATEGQGPKSQAEFMEKIIQFNRIKLPQLPPDAKYVYDVEQETLMVERPRKQ
jgi:hypothetical protein